MEGATRQPEHETAPGVPAVSVVIPCYRQAEFLTEAIESVVTQTRRDWEIVVVDDGSPDDVAGVAEQAIARFGPRVRLLRQPNRGVSEARNAGIRASSGRFVVPLDADDRLHPEYLERTIALLEANPGVGIAYTDYELFGGASRVVRVPEFDADGLYQGNHILNTATYRRAAFDAVGGYDPRMTLAFEDWEFWIGCFERGFLPQRLPLPLVAYRIRAGSRNDRSRAERLAMLRQVRANHPAAYTRRRQLVRRLRRLPRNVLRHTGRMFQAISGGRFRPGPERW